MATEKMLIEEFIPNTIFMFLLLVVGLIGNLIVIYIYHLRMFGNCGEETRLCILFMAYSDLVASTFGSSFGIGMNFHPLSFFNNFACKSVWFITTVCVFTSGLVLVLISFYRFSAVCRPQMKRFDIMRTKFMLSIVLIFSITISAPCLFLYGTFRTPIDNGQIVLASRCGKIYKMNSLFIYHMAYDTVVIVVGVSGISLMSIFYALVGRVIIRQMNFRKSLNDHKKYRQNQMADTQEKQEIEEEVNNTVSADLESSSKTTTSEQCSEFNAGQLFSTIRDKENGNISQLKETIDKYRFSIMFCIISLIFALSYTPRVYIMIREIINPTFWDQISLLEFKVSLFLYRMYIINNVSNCFLYLIFDQRFRKEVKSLFCYHCRH